MSTILGEDNPGFNLWTSAHGFHHLSLSQNSKWRIFWGIVLAISCIALICCVIYYFYYVFTFAIYSRFLLENPPTINWPTTIICDRQMFSASKINQAPLLSSSHASLITWFVNPTLARPEIMNSTRVGQLTVDINTALSRSTYSQAVIPGGAKEQLLRALAPNCTQFILQCIVGKRVMTGVECCSQIFDPNPYFTQAGTCFSTRGAPYRPKVKVAGDASGLTVTTMHDVGNSFDPLFVSSDIYGVSGLNFAVVDDHVTPQAAMAGRAMSVLPGQVASVGISRMTVDNNDLGWSAIARSKCVSPGERNPRWVDADLNYGLTYSYGYTMDSCLLISKPEMIARELLFCTFNPLVGDTMERCVANQSAAYFYSFIGNTNNNNIATPELPIYRIEDKPGLKTRYDKVCPADCIQDRFSLSPSYSAFTDAQRQTLTTLVASSGQAIQGANTNTIILKLYMRSLEYQRIYNFPQNGVQFIAELGGLMGFFLGISIISLIECMCYGCFCGCRDKNDDEKDTTAIRKVKSWNDD